MQYTVIDVLRRVKRASGSKPNEPCNTLLKALQSVLIQSGKHSLRGNFYGGQLWAELALDELHREIPGECMCVVCGVWGVRGQLNKNNNNFINLL